MDGWGRIDPTGTGQEEPLHVAVVPVAEDRDVPGRVGERPCGAEVDVLHQPVRRGPVTVVVDVEVGATRDAPAQERERNLVPPTVAVLQDSRLSVCTQFYRSGETGWCGEGPSGEPNGGGEVTETGGPEGCRGRSRTGVITGVVT